MKRYPEKVMKFIEANVSGMRTNDLVDLVNDRFNAGFTVAKMRSYMKNHGLKNGLPTRIKGEGFVYPKEIRKFIEEHYIGIGHKDMADMVNNTFGTNYTKEQIKGCYARYKFDSGLTGQYEKGNIPFNKGKPKYWIGGEETQFKAGSIPPNRVHIGAERIDSKDGYIYVKIQDGHLNKNWKQKHVLIWEEYNGPIPKGYVVIFGDGDKSNVDLENLILVSRQQLLVLNRHNLIQSDADLTRTAVIIADLTTKICEKRRSV